MKGIFSIEGKGPYFLRHHIIIKMSYLKKELTRSLLVQLMEQFAYYCFSRNRLLTNSKYLGVNKIHSVYLTLSYCIYFRFSLFQFVLHNFQGTKRKDLALPESIKTSIQSIPLNSGSDVRDIVIQFQEALQLEPASLASPEPETKSMIRVLALRAKSEKRDDLVRHLREITPAGTTGEF